MVTLQDIFFVANSDFFFVYSTTKAPVTTEQFAFFHFQDLEPTVQVLKYICAEGARNFQLYLFNASHAMRNLGICLIRHIRRMAFMGAAQCIYQWR